MSQPNALDYARHYKIVVDHRQHFQQHYQAALKTIAQDVDKIDIGVTQKNTLTHVFDYAAGNEPVESDQDLRLTTEQLELLKDSTISPPSALQLSKTSLWQHLLPDHKYIRNLYVEKPLLHIGGGDVERDKQRVRKGVNLEAIIQDVHDEWQAEHQGYTKEIDNDNKSRIVHQLTRDPKARFTLEKLEVTDDTIDDLLHMLQDVDSPSFEYLLQNTSQHHKTLYEPIDTLEPDENDVSIAKRSFPVSASSSSQGSRQFLYDDDLMNTEEMVKLLDASHVDTRMDTSHISPSSMKLAGDRSQDLSQPHTKKVHKIESNTKNAIELDLERVWSLSPMSEMLRSDDIEFEQSIYEIETPEDRKPTKMNSTGDISNLLVKIEGGIDQGLSLTQSLDACNELVPANPPSLSKKEVTVDVETDFTVSQDPLTKFVLSEEAQTCGFLPGRTRDKHLENIISECFPQSTNFPEKDNLRVRMPFPTIDLACFQAEELEAANIGATILDQPKPVRSFQLLWNPPGIRVLNSSDGTANEDESAFEAYSDDESFAEMQELRTSLSQDHNVPATCFPEKTRVDSSLSAKSPTSTKPAMVQKCSKPPTISLSRSSSHMLSVLEFSTSNSLSNFLELRGRKFNIGRPASTCEELCDDPIEPTQCSDVARSFASGRGFSMTRGNECSSRSNTEPEIGLPNHETLSWHRTVVVNNELLQSNPTLVTFCEKSGGSLLTIVYRDFIAVDGFAPDIILGPNSCLMLANLQSFIQKWLPGQKKSPWQSLIHEKIAKLCRRFEMVVLVVTWSLTTMPDTLTLTELTAFCLSISQALSSEIRIRYAPYCKSAGPQATINAWIWSTIAQVAFPTQTLLQSSPETEAISFIQDETVWELFLRAAGLNTMAAQLVPSILKAQMTDMRKTDKSERRLSHLSQFVRMSLEERLSMFGNIMGSRTIRSVSSFMDSKRQM